ncbi:3-ketodihydrosphingosine reductase isoform X1 [Nematostella vectensis]|uniref:3-ketodihydrosphingosine reductase isoform X1 n=1 Tax=Nematostella vectensis TaxID=45351 RepID=UPI0020777C85|nr:3-ketodihydrosphingosine reductase isoform X1 [Nematostella vectensis]
MFVEAVIGLASFIAVLLALDLLYRKKTQINGSHAIVTGGSSGIGRALAVQLAQQGASVTLLARNKAKLEGARQQVEKHLQPGRKVSVFSVDLCQSVEAVQKVIDEACLALGPVNLLFNCAGYAVCGVFEDTRPEDFKNMINTNYLGSVYPTYAVMKGMKKRGCGHVVFTSSIGGQFGIFGMSAYSGSKFAVRGFAECLYMEAKLYNVAVSVAFPPDTDTPGFENENKEKPEETKLICGSAGLFSPDQVAQTILQGVKCRQFLISCGVEGWAMKIVTCGAAPSTSWLDLIQQISLMGLLRLVMVISATGFDKIVAQCKQKRTRISH